LIQKFLVACLSLLPFFAFSEARVFEFSYEVKSLNLPPGQTIDIYVPLPVIDDSQQIIEENLFSSLPGTEGIEAVYGNRYYRVSRAPENNEPIDLKLKWTVSRKVQEAGGTKEFSNKDAELYLKPNEKVPVGHQVLNPILAEIYAMRTDDSADATSRAIYDWVVDNVEYKKIGTGWGNGDTFWACNERYGNCTDFHALFISLARTEGIPARFEIGFPVPEDRAAGVIGGYHCWVEFYLPGIGWVPIDASEAAKHPEKKELFYGTHPADRIHFSSGRDLAISETAAAKPLNYFIYPYVEVDGRPSNIQLETRFSYRELDF